LEDLLQLVLKSYGIVGVMLLLPVAACVVLWKQNIVLHNEVVAQSSIALEAQKQRSTDQSARVKDNERMTERLMDIIKEQTELNTEINNVLSRVVETVAQLERQALVNGRG
jgi:hypothetical protein